MRHEQAAEQTLSHLRSEARSWERTRERAETSLRVLKQRGVDCNPEFTWQVSELRSTSAEAWRNAETLRAAIVLLETN